MKSRISDGDGGSRLKLSVTLTLTAAVLVSFLAVEILAGVAKRNLERQAISQAELSSRFLSAVISSDLTAGEWIMQNALSWLFNMEDVGTVKDDGTGYQDSLMLFHRTIDDRHLSAVTVDDVYEMLWTFLEYNENYKSAIMAFKPGVLKNTGERGFAARLQLGDTTRHELVSQGYNVFGNDLYRDFSKSRRNTWFKAQTVRDSVQVLTLGVPLYDSRDSLIGYFLSDCDPSYLSALLSAYSSQADLGAFVIDSTGLVVASAQPELNGRMLKDIVEGCPQLGLGQQWLQQVQECTWESGSASVQAASERRHKHDITYIRPLKSAKFRIVVIKSGSQIFDILRRFKLSLWGISFCSLLLILGCALHINNSYRRKSRQNNLMAGELNAAGVIQMGILPPNPGNAVKGRVMNLPQQADVYGLQIQATVVGGDMYDYVLKDNSLYFVIGDVSGKGVPAALVMAQISSLLRYIISQKDSPEQILSELNNAVMERSDDSVLCTMTIGALNIETGQLQLANAGHTRPLLVPLNGDPSFLKLRAGMPVYGFVNYPYLSETFRMLPGDKLLLYTDGVTESRDESGEFFGEDRTLQAVRGQNGADAANMVAHVMDRLVKFSGNAVQHDDITMLCVHFKGGNTSNLRFESVRNRVTSIVDEILKAAGRPDDLRLRLAIEEPVQNISDYAYKNRGGDGPLDVSVYQTVGSDGQQRVSFVLKDQGFRFNPLQMETPDFSVPLEQRQIGGLGIHFTRSIMESLDYEYTAGRNILHLTYLIKNED